MELQNDFILRNPAEARLLSGVGSYPTLSEVSIKGDPFNQTTNIFLSKSPVLHFADVIDHFMYLFVCDVLSDFRKVKS